MATFATWMLRRRADAQFVWQKQGAAPPEVVTDNKTYHETFSASFPQVHITWGPGDFEMLVSSADGGTYKVGSVKCLTAPDFSTENRAMVVAGQAPKLQLREESVDTSEQSGEIHMGARVVESQDLQKEARETLGTSGIPGGVQVVDSFQNSRPGLDQGGTLESHFKGQEAPRNHAPAETLVIKATEDTPDFIMLLRNTQRCLLPRDTNFSERVRGLPALVVNHFRANPDRWGLGETVLAGRKFVGLVDDGFRYQLPVAPFVAEDSSPKTLAFIRWWRNYQNVEAWVEAAQGQCLTTEDLDQCICRSLEMVHDATELFLLDSGWDPATDPIPCTEIHQEVLDAMASRANFLADKDKEYGQPTRRHGLYGVVIRVFDKISRYTTLRAGAVTPKFESALDSLKDLGGYSMILAAALLEERDRINAEERDRINAEGEDKRAEA